MSGTQTDNLDEAVEKVCGMLADSRKTVVLCHVSPDGDTVGSAFALGRALLRRGGRVRVECSDAFPDKYDYMYRGMPTSDFAPDLVVASDVAGENLLGEKLSRYRGKIDLCIDHHPSNTHYAAYTLLMPGAAATCEIMAGIIERLGVPLAADIADCLYTGLATDTGCFRYSNTTPAALRLAARLIESGANSAGISKRMFETVSRERLALESLALATLEYHMDGRVAVITVTREMCRRTGAADTELEGIPSIPARIAGVQVGVTVKEKENGEIKVSVRTNGGVDASAICARLGGGGHTSAAGCALESCTVEQARRILLDTVARVLPPAGA